MKVLSRDPAVLWRVERKREEQALRILAGEEAGDAESLGTMTLLAGGSMHQLNLLGGEVWKLCDGTRDRAALLAEIAARFEAGEEEVRESVEGFLADLAARGLVREEER